MTITIFISYPFERPYLTSAAQDQHTFHFLYAALTQDTAAQAVGSTAVSVFVNDDASGPVLETRQGLGVRYLLVRAAGHDNVDLPAAHRLGLRAANACRTTPLSPLPSTPWP